MPHILLIDAAFYTDLSNELVHGAAAEIAKSGSTYERVSVPGALEITPAIRYALETSKYDGFVALGCVIRGETSHYDTVCEESARGITWLGIEFMAAIGNGILTVENEAQAWERANRNEGNKGGQAAQACLQLIALKRKFGLTVENDDRHSA